MMRLHHLSTEKLGNAGVGWGGEYNLLAHKPLIDTNHTKLQQEPDYRIRKSRSTAYVLNLEGFRGTQACGSKDPSNEITMEHPRQGSGVKRNTAGTTSSRWAISSQASSGEL